MRVAPNAGFRVKAPVKDQRLAFAHAEPVVEWCRPALRPSRTECPDADLVDPDRERLARAGSANLDRPDQRVSCVELLVARLERLAGRDMPTRVETRESDGVAAVDREDRRQVAREVAVQRVPLEFGSCSLSGSATSASRRPGAKASSCSASSRYDTPATLITLMRGSSLRTSSPVAASRSRNPAPARSSQSRSR